MDWLMWYTRFFWARRRGFLEAANGDVNITVKNYHRLRDDFSNRFPQHFFKNYRMTRKKAIKGGYWPLKRWICSYTGGVAVVNE